MDNIEKDMAKKDKTKMKVRKFRNNLSEDAKNAIREIDRKKHSSKRTQLTEDERVELCSSAVEGPPAHKPQQVNLHFTPTIQFNESSLLIH